MRLVFMIAGISSGFSTYSYLLNVVSSNTNNIETDNNSFENLINNTPNNIELISAEDIENTEKIFSDKKTKDMDLNRDGTITIDEVITYMELQMRESLQENLETREMQGENNGQNKNPFNKTLQVAINQAINAYSMFK